MHLDGKIDEVKHLDTPAVSRNSLIPNKKREMNIHEGQVGIY